MCSMKIHIVFCLAILCYETLVFTASPIILINCMHHVDKMAKIKVFSSIGAEGRAKTKFLQRHLVKALGTVQLVPIRLPGTIGCKRNQIRIGFNTSSTEVPPVEPVLNPNQCYLHQHPKGIADDRAITAPQHCAIQTRILPLD